MPSASSVRIDLRDRPFDLFVTVLIRCTFWYVVLVVPLGVLASASLEAAVFCASFTLVSLVASSLTQNLLIGSGTVEIRRWWRRRRYQTDAIELCAARAVPFSNVWILGIRDVESQRRPIPLWVTFALVRRKREEIYSQLASVVSTRSTGTRIIYVS